MLLSKHIRAILTPDFEMVRDGSPLVLQYVTSRQQGPEVTCDPITETQGLDVMRYLCSVVLADKSPFSAIHKCMKTYSQKPSP
jgi:hypothetical protein